MEAKPFDIFLDGVHILGIFLSGVGVVVAEIGFATIFLCKSEIDAQALGMAEVKVSVRFRRETREDTLYLAGLKVVFDDLFKKIQFSGFFFHSNFLQI